MKINASGLDRYQSVVQQAKTGEAAKPRQGARAANTDKVTISGDAAARAGLSRLASSVAAEVDASASPARIEQLRTAVQDGSYHVETGDIADAILARLDRTV